MKKNVICKILPLFLIGLCLLCNSGCSKKEFNDDSGEEDVVKDIDGNVYSTVKIGDQVWMSENLRVTKFRNGDLIPNIVLPTYSAPNSNIPTVVSGNYILYVWPTTAYTCDVNNQRSNRDNCGLLYNGYTLTDSRNIAPKGWRVPTNEDFIQLNNYLKSNGMTARSLASKENWLTNWDPNMVQPGSILVDSYKNNSTGFNGMPIGYYDSFNSWTPLFQNVGYSADWWTSEGGYYLLMGYFVEPHDPFSSPLTKSPSCCLSIRCIKE